MPMMLLMEETITTLTVIDSKWKDLASQPEHQILADTFEEDQGLRPRDQITE